jgi:hypothetical protein
MFLGIFDQQGKSKKEIRSHVISFRVSFKHSRDRHRDGRLWISSAPIHASDSSHCTKRLDSTTPAKEGRHMSLPGVYQSCKAAPSSSTPIHPLLSSQSNPISRKKTGARNHHSLYVSRRLSIVKSSTRTRLYKKYSPAPRLPAGTARL